MANKHGVSANVMKRMNASRKKGKAKKMNAVVYTGNENFTTRKNTSYKRRKHYLENKNAFPKKKLKTKKIEDLIAQGVIDKRGFFLKGKKKNYFAIVAGRKNIMVDADGRDFWGMARGY